MAEKKGKSKLRVDFGGVDKEIRGKSERSARVPEGDYHLKIISAEVKKSEKTDSKYVSWKFQIVAPTEYKGKTLFSITSLKKDALWNLRNLIHAATGKNVAGKAMDLDLEKLYGKVVGATVEDDTYTKNEGERDEKTVVRSRPSTFFPKDEADLADSDDEEDEEDDEEETEDDDEDEEEDLEEVEVDEL